MSETNTKKNWDDVVVLGENGLYDRDATIAELDTFLAEQSQIQEQMADAIDTVFASMPGSKNVVGDTILSLAALSITKDADRFTSLKETGKRILSANYTVVKGQHGGYANPHYVEPKTDKKQ